MENKSDFFVNERIIYEKALILGYSGRNKRSIITEFEDIVPWFNFYARAYIDFNVNEISRLEAANPLVNNEKDSVLESYMDNLMIKSFLGSFGYRGDELEKKLIALEDKLKKSGSALLKELVSPDERIVYVLSGISDLSPRMLKVIGQLVNKRTHELLLLIPFDEYKFSSNFEKRTSQLRFDDDRILKMPYPKGQSITQNIDRGSRSYQL
jgi:hypothetical protein